jgi:hypothetical protein
MARINWKKHADRIFAVLLDEYMAASHGYRFRALERLYPVVGSASMSAFNNYIDNNNLAAKVQATAVHMTKKEEAEPLEADHPELRKAERTILNLRDDRADLRKKLKEADKKANITSRMEEIIRDELQPMDASPFEPREFEGEYKVDGVQLLSDEHADHRVLPDLTLGLEDFDFNIFRIRLERLADTLVGYCSSHLPKYLFERLWIFKLGDASQGDIHNMKHRNHFSNSVKAAIAIADVEADFIAKLSPFFPGGVHVVSVGGNHTRTTQGKQDEDPHDNLDYVITCGIAQRLRNLIDLERVTVHAPHAWTALVDVRGWTMCLNHGDNVRGFAGFPWYGFDRREGRVKALLNRVLDRPIDYFMYGHFHTSITRTTADSKAIHNGAFYQTGGYEVNQLALGNSPEQQFMVFQDREDDRGHILQVPMYLRNREKEAAYRLGEYEPNLGRVLTLDVIDNKRTVPGIAPVITAP